MIDKKLSNSIEKPYLEEIVKNNDINFLLNFKNNGDIISYENDGLISLKDNFAGIIDIDNFIKLFLKIVEKVQSLQIYMIFEENLYLNLNDIYIDTKDNIFLMLSLEAQKNDLKTLYQEVLEKVCFKLGSNCKDLIEINNYFNTENYSANGILKLLRNKDVNLKTQDESEIKEKINNNKFTKEKKEGKKTFFSNWFSKKKTPVVKENELDNIFKL